MAQVMTDTWELRRARTEVLRGRYPFAAEMLDLNAALLAVAILGGHRSELRKRLHEFRAEEEQKIKKETLP